MRSTFRLAAAAALLLLAGCYDPARPPSRTEGTYEAQITGDFTVAMRGYSADAGSPRYSTIVMGRDPAMWRDRPDTLIFVESRTLLQPGTYPIRDYGHWDRVTTVQQGVIAYAVVSAPGGRPRYISIDGSVTIKKVTRRGREGAFSFRAFREDSPDSSRYITSRV